MRTARILACTLLALFFTRSAAMGAGNSAVEGAGSSTEKGMTFYETFYGGSNTLGQVYKLDSTIGYNFNRYLGVDAGLPVYFLNPSSSSSASGFQSGSGIGNAYVDLNLTFRNPIVNYASTIEGTAPTGNKNLGLTTGRFTYDWNNHFDRSFILFTPFANVGIANTVSDTPLFTRPFTTFGHVAHFEGGVVAGVLPFISVGASVYDVVPTGTQKVFSRFNPNRGVVMASGMMGGRFFENAHETIGGSDLASDNGASVWAGIRLFHVAEAQVGYTRSVRYDLNTFSFGIGFNVGRLIHGVTP